MSDPVSDQYPSVVPRPHRPHRIVLVVNLKIEPIDDFSFLFVRAVALGDNVAIARCILHYPPANQMVLYKRDQPTLALTSEQTVNLSAPRSPILVQNNIKLHRRNRNKPAQLDVSDDVLQRDLLLQQGMTSTERTKRASESVFDLQHMIRI